MPATFCICKKSIVGISLVFFLCFFFAQIQRKHIQGNKGESIGVSGVRGLLCRGSGVTASETSVLDRAGEPCKLCKCTRRRLRGGDKSRESMLGPKSHTPQGMRPRCIFSWLTTIFRETLLAWPNKTEQKHITYPGIPIHQTKTINKCMIHQKCMIHR